jgi:hypothetical protein
MHKIPHNAILADRSYSSNHRLIPSRQTEVREVREVKEVREAREVREVREGLEWLGRIGVRRICVRDRAIRVSNDCI